MPRKFLDTKIFYKDNQIKTKIHRNERKLPAHWASKILKRYKRNCINADLNRATQIASTFPEEIPTIKQKFLSADYPLRFVNSVIKQFNEKCNGNTQDHYIIPPDYFDVPKTLVLADIPYCARNETLPKRFIKKFHEFTNNSYGIRIKWITKTVKQLFKLKSKNPHPSCVIYEGVCVCEQTYIGETRRNVELRWEEHENISKDSEPAKHLKENLSHKFTCKILFAAPENIQIRKILEAFEIVLKRPSLHEQIESKKLFLFRNGVT